MEENVGLEILRQVNVIASKVNTMSSAITNLAMNQCKLSDRMLDMKEEIIDVRTELKEEIQGVRTELKEEIQGVRTELKEEIQGVRAELKEEIQGVRAELKEEIQGVRAEFKQETTEIKEQLQDVKECAYFVKETNETIIEAIERQRRKLEKVVNDHEKRICVLENTRPKYIEII